MPRILRTTLFILLMALYACDSGYAPNVSYTDPFTGQTMKVYASYLALIYSPLDKPWNQEGYYDLPPQELNARMSEYQAWQAGGFHTDPALQSFIAKERVKVIQWWDGGPMSRGPGLTVAVPNGVTLEDAVARWSAEYAHLFSLIHTLPVSTYDPAYVAP